MFVTTASQLYSYSTPVAISRTLTQRMYAVLILIIDLRIRIHSLRTCCN